MSRAGKRRDDADDSRCRKLWDTGAGLRLAEAGGGGPGGPWGLGLGGRGGAGAETRRPRDKRFKSWTMICRKAPLAKEEGATTAPQPYCRAYYRVRAAENKDEVIFISTVQFLGKDRVPMMRLTMPAVA